LSDDVELAVSDNVAQVMGSKGANLFEIRIANGDRAVGLLPNKFRNLIWIKRNDFVVITGLSSEPGSAAAAAAPPTASATAPIITFEIKEILNKSHIKQLKARNLWPAEFGDGHSGNGGGATVCVDSYLGDLGDDGEDAGDDDGEGEEEEEEEEERDARGNTVVKPT